MKMVNMWEFSVLQNVAFVLLAQQVSQVFCANAGNFIFFFFFNQFQLPNVNHT